MSAFLLQYAHDRKNFGTVAGGGEKYILVDTASGVGYKIFATDEALLFAKEGEKISFFVHTSVREDAIDLYGFLKQEELAFFEMLIGSVSGVGPKSALSIVNTSSVENLKKAVARRDLAYLTKVSGIGRKTAEKIIFELAEKFEDSYKAELPGAKSDQDALEGLVSLGYSQQEGREALKKVDSKIESASARIKEALKILAD